MAETTMKALLCEAHGAPETLRMRDVPIPTPSEGEVRIRVAAAGLNFPDALIVENRYQTKPPLPFSPGGEAAGIIDSIGPKVDNLAIGDRVAALTIHGAFAEFVLAKASATMRLPDSMPLRDAGGFTLTYATSHHALKQRAALRAGETVLVLGAAGGVGLAAVEIGKAMGAYVIAAASSEEKLTIARDAGADQTINYAKGDLRDTFKSIAGTRDIDVIYDPVGDRFTEPAFRSIAWGGRHLVVGFAAGAIPTLSLNLALLKNASIVGVFWGEFVNRSPVLHAENMAELFDWYSQGKLRPLISRSFSLEEGGAAIRWMMDRKAVGKVIVSVDPLTI